MFWEQNCMKCKLFVPCQARHWRAALALLGALLMAPGGELSFGKLSAPAQRSQPPEIFSDGILRISWMCCSLVYEFLICDLMAVPSLQKVVSVEFRSLGGWVCFFFLLKSGFSEDVLVTDCRYKSTQLADNKEELYSVFSTEMISFVGIR